MNSVTLTTTTIAVQPCYASLWWVLRDGCDSNHRAADVGPIEGFFADGWGGQYIAVVPTTNLVAVRTTTPPAPGIAVAVDEIDRRSFYPFPHEAAKLVR